MNLGERLHANLPFFGFDCCKNILSPSIEVGTYEEKGDPAGRQQDDEEKLQRFHLDGFSLLLLWFSPHNLQSASACWSLEMALEVTG